MYMCVCVWKRMCMWGRGGLKDVSASLLALMDADLTEALKFNIISPKIQLSYILPSFSLPCSYFVPAVQSVNGYMNPVDEVFMDNT